MRLKHETKHVALHPSRVRTGVRFPSPPPLFSNEHLPAAVGTDLKLFIIFKLFRLLLRHQFVGDD